MDGRMRDRIRGCAVGAAVGDALGMPLEFGPRRPADRLVREMLPGRLPAGTFTDDTEMALALVDSLLACGELDPADAAKRFASWLEAGPGDVGNHTRAVLSGVASGMAWEEAADSEQRRHPDSAGNGSVMRCWPVAVARWDDLQGLLSDSRLQSRATHPHSECVAACAWVNALLYHLFRDVEPTEAIRRAMEDAPLPPALQAVAEAAPGRGREELRNSGWVRHTLESALWGLMTTGSFEEAVVQVVNLGNDADTAGTVVGALAGAAYGLSAIPKRWAEAVQGQWPLRSGVCWRLAELVDAADRLAACCAR